MDSEDRLSQRVAHIKQALYDLTSSLQPFSPYVRPSTSSGFLSPDYDDPSLSGRSEVYGLRRQLEWTEGKVRRLEEKLRAMEGTCREMNELMQELYSTVEELQDEKRRADEAITHMKDVELHYDSLRKQITTLQSTLAHKELQLSQFQHDHVSMLSQLQPTEPSPTAQFLTSEVQRLEREKDSLRAEKELLERENWRRREDGELRTQVQRLQEDLASVHRERDSLATTLSAKDAEITDLQEKIYEKQLVAEAFKKPVKPESKEFRSFFASVASILGDQPSSDLLATIHSLHQSRKQASASLSLVSKMAKLIQDCAPAEASGERLTAKQIWRWVRRLVEEFMRLKERCEGVERDWAEARQLLGVKSQADLLPALSRALQDLRQLQSLEGKVKALVSDPIKIHDN